MTKSYRQSVKKTLLTETEMETLDRDLSFRPASPQTARTLTSERVESFNRDGYLLPLPLFTDSEIEYYRHHFDQLLENALATGSDSNSIVDPHLYDSTIYDLMFHPRLVAYARDLVGPDIVCWGTHYFCKLSHDNRQVAWHQDAYYWPLTPTRTVTVWLAIDNSDLENGCMQFVTGSHRIGAVPHRVSREDEKNLLRVTADGVETLGGIANVTLRAGQISLHSDMLLHGSDANTSDRRRCGLTIRYADAGVRDLKDWSAYGVLVQGEDRNGQWGNPARPQS